MAERREGVEAEFCGESSVEVLKRIVEFAKGAGLSVVETCFIGTLHEQEVHRATFEVRRPPGPPLPEEARRGAEEVARRLQKALSELQAELSAEAGPCEEERRPGQERWEPPARGPQAPRLPEGPMYIGRTLGLGERVGWHPRDLATNVLIGGEMESGKTLAASIFAEEALKMGVPVLAFDTTGEWRGLLRPNTEKRIVGEYPLFGMKPEEARGLPGEVREVTDPHLRVDLKVDVNSGRATIFDLSHMRPGEIDQAVMSVVDSILRWGLEECDWLRLLLVFDDVHLLLEKYGGHGGYVALTRGARELRALGVGMVMTCRSISHLPEDLRANVLTEIELRNLNPADVDRISAKHGRGWGAILPHQEPGSGLLADPRFSRGRPVPVVFRPPLHAVLSHVAGEPPGLEG